MTWEESQKEKYEKFKRTYEANRITEVPPDSDEITSEQKSCALCGTNIPHGTSRIKTIDGILSTVCPNCADSNPSIQPIHPDRITLDFCMWVQASFNELVEEINKGIKTYKASAK